MKAFLTHARDESGQAIALVVGILLVLVVMMALIMDLGFWYRADRAAQTAADAAALAGAQDLPNRGAAEGSANVWWSKNADPSSAVHQDNLGFPNPGEPTSQITVKVTRKAENLFAKLFGILDVTVQADAQAAVSVPLTLKNVAPVALKSTEACFISDPACFNTRVTIDFDYSNIAPGMYGLINVECYSDTSSYCGSGSLGGNALRNVITNGWPNPLPANKWYGVKTGNTVGPVDQGLTDAANLGKTLLFPVWDTASAADKTFHIIGWAAFVIDRGGVNWGSQEKKLTGHFVTFIATDVAGGGTIDGASDFGVHVITLTQ